MKLWLVRHAQPLVERNLADLLRGPQAITGETLQTTPQQTAHVGKPQARGQQGDCERQQRRCVPRTDHSCIHSTLSNTDGG